MSEELTAVRSVLTGTDGPSDRAWTEARAALMAEIEGVTRPGRRRRRWVPATGLVAALGVAAAVLLVTQVFVRGGVVRPSPAAAAVLRRAADAALASPPERLRAGQYWYTANEGTYLDTTVTRHGTISAFVSQIEREWVGKRCGARHDRLVRVRPVTSRTKAWQRRALSGFQANPSFSGCGGQPDQPVSYGQMLRAPRPTPELGGWVLRAEVARGFTPKPSDRPQLMFTTIHDILIEPMVPARLQAGLYRVAATIPGIQMLGMRRDTLGRSGLAVGFVDQHSGYEDELLFDPKSYALLDYDETTRHRSGALPAGTITEETAFLAAGLVHHIGQVIRPHG
jgi:hypothetical protein